ncbi:hypothetical protein PS870_06380 [Pseudomonas fluorescens]|uniref:HTH lysR-type domain-containing protein n=1 Tax=Pseudomonas fluorescens TaxID=294 RepID=A0A5E7QJF6_PSEFL|nr:hypothetical protein PS870_06380 [Pseudomonas fluorescens]
MINALDDLIDLKRIRHLVILADELNFSRAAIRASLSQTAFSRSVQSLERDLNLRLFDRTTRSVQLTAAGRQLLVRARTLLDMADHLTVEADYLATAEGGELKFGASLMVSSGVLHDVMNTLRSRSPAARLDIVVNHGQHLCQLLVDGDLEFFIANADVWANDIRFAITPLTPRPASIFCSADHPLARNKVQLTSALLLDYPWAFINLTETTENHIRHLLNLAENTALPIGLNCNDFNLLRHATLKSNYLLFTWNDWLADDLNEGVIVDLKYQLTPELPQETFYLNYAIVQVAGKTLSPIAQRAITLIQEFAQKSIPANPAS